MALRRNDDNGADLPDSFDILPPMPAAGSSFPAAVEPNPNVLSADKVLAVRFHPAKPGYAYNQVETFVDQVTATLRYLEQRMYQDNVRIHDLNEEIQNLQEKNLTLQATIEVLRVKGDVVARNDGSLVTQSQVAGGSGDAAVVDTSGYEAQIAELVRERDGLVAELAEVRTAEADLRRYLDEELQPWIDGAMTSQQALQDALDAKERELQSALASAQVGGSNQIPPHVQDMLARGEAQVEAAQREVTAMQAQLSAMQARAEAAEQRAEYAERVAADAQVKIATLEMQSVSASSTTTPAVEAVDTGMDAVSGPEVSETPSVSPRKSSAKMPPAAPPRVRRLLDSPEAAAAEAEGIDVSVDAVNAQIEEKSMPEAGRPVPRLLADSPEARALAEDEEA